MSSKARIFSPCECTRPIPDIDSGDCVKCGHTIPGLLRQKPDRKRERPRPRRLPAVAAA